MQTPKGKRNELTSKSPKKVNSDALFLPQQKCTNGTRLVIKNIVANTEHVFRLNVRGIQITFCDQLFSYWITPFLCGISDKLCSTKTYPTT